MYNNGLTSFFDDLFANQTRARRVLSRRLDATQEIPVVTAAQLLATVDTCQADTIAEYERIALASRDLDRRLQPVDTYAAHVGELAEMARLAIAESERAARALDAMEGGQ